MEAKTALIAGATGLVGSELLKMLLDDKHYNKVISVVRKKTSNKNPKLQELVVDFDDLHKYSKELAADDFFCCLGTTMKKAGSKENFAKVDYLYPVNLASIAEKNKAKCFSLISAMGADEKSFVFYNKVKGTVEEDILKKNIPAILIFRPSLILGDRKEERFGEEIAQYLSGPLSQVLVGPLKKYRPIEAFQIAEGMIKASNKKLNGKHIYNSEDIKNI